MSITHIKLKDRYPLHFDDIPDDKLVKINWMEKTIELHVNCYSCPSYNKNQKKLLKSPKVSFYSTELNFFRNGFIIAHPAFECAPISVEINIDTIIGVEDNGDCYTFESGKGYIEKLFDSLILAIKSSKCSHDFRSFSL
jgi:hypothetical protein